MGVETFGATVETGRTTGNEILLSDSDGPVTVTVKDVSPVRSTRCGFGHERIPCFSGLQTAAGEPLPLFGIPGRTLHAVTDELSLPSPFSGPDFEPTAYSARSDDPSVVTVSVSNGIHAKNRLWESCEMSIFVVSHFPPSAEIPRRSKRLYPTDFE